MTTVFKDFSCKGLNDTMKQYLGYLTNLDLQTLSNKKLRTLQKNITAFFAWSNTKRNEYKDKFGESVSFEELMSAILASYVDVVLCLSRIMSAKKRVDEGNNLCMKVFFILSSRPETLNVILLLKNMDQSHLDMMKPLCRKCLAQQYNKDAAMYTKHLMLHKKLSSLWSKELADELLIASRLLPPKNYLGWVGSMDKKVFDSLDLKAMDGDGKIRNHFMTRLKISALQPIVDKMFKKVRSISMKVLPTEVDDDTAAEDIMHLSDDEEFINKNLHDNDDSSDDDSDDSSEKKEVVNINSRRLDDVRPHVEYDDDSDEAAMETESVSDEIEEEIEDGVDVMQISRKAIDEVDLTSEPDEDDICARDEKGPMSSKEEGDSFEAQPIFAELPSRGFKRSFEFVSNDDDDDDDDECSVNQTQRIKPSSPEKSPEGENEVKSADITIVENDAINISIVLPTTSCSDVDKQQKPAMLTELVSHISQSQQQIENIIQSTPEKCLEEETADVVMDRRDGESSPPSPSSKAGDQKDVEVVSDDISEEENESKSARDVVENSTAGSCSPLLAAACSEAANQKEVLTVTDVMPSSECSQQAIAHAQYKTIQAQVLENEDKAMDLTKNCELGSVCSEGKLAMSTEYDCDNAEYLVIDISEDHDSREMRDAPGTTAEDTPLSPSPETPKRSPTNQINVVSNSPANQGALSSPEEIDPPVCGTAISVDDIQQPAQLSELFEVIPERANEKFVEEAPKDEGSDNSSLASSRRSSQYGNKSSDAISSPRVTCSSSAASISFVPLEKMARSKQTKAEVASKDESLVDSPTASHATRRSDSDSSRVRNQRGNKGPGVDSSQESCASDAAFVSFVPLEKLIQLEQSKEEEGSVGSSMTSGRTKRSRGSDSNSSKNRNQKGKKISEAISSPRESDISNGDESSSGGQPLRRSARLGGKVVKY